MIINKTIQNNQNQNDNKAAVKQTLFIPSSKLANINISFFLKMLFKCL